jgi:hypothetical protein
MKRAFLALPLVCLAATGCNTASLTQSTNDLDAAYYGSCPPGPVVDCDSGPGSGTACTSEPDSGNASVRLIPGDASVPSGCTIRIPGPVDNDAGTCTLAALCTCANPSASQTDGGSQWRCEP